MNTCDTVSIPEHDGIAEIQGIEVTKKNFLQHQETVI
jgi:hypothetical protein